MKPHTCPCGRPCERARDARGHWYFRVRCETHRTKHVAEMAKRNTTKFQREVATIDRLFLQAQRWQQYRRRMGRAA